MNPFDRLVEALVKAGYDVTITTVVDGSNHRFGQSKSNHVFLGFCEKNDKSYRHINGMIAADHKGCFNKWSQCPYVDYLPETDEAAEKIIENLNWLGTNEAFHWSDSFSYIDDPKLPKVCD